MQVIVRQQVDHAVVRLRGELDALSRARVMEEMGAVAGPGPSRVVLNLHDVRFVDSTGLEAILRISQDLAGRGGRLAVSSPSTFCRSVMEKIGLDRFLPILDSDEEAIAALLAGVPTDRD